MYHSLYNVSGILILSTLILSALILSTFNFNFNFEYLCFQVSISSISLIEIILKYWGGVHLIEKLLESKALGAIVIAQW